MPRSVIRYFSAQNAAALEKTLDQFANDNPNWEIVSASHQLIPTGISLIVVVKHISQPGAPPPSFSEDK